MRSVRPRLVYLSLIGLKCGPVSLKLKLVYLPKQLFHLNCPEQHKEIHIFISISWQDSQACTQGLRPGRG